MSLQTPGKIRTFQRKLYLKAKAEPDFRFYLLYDKIYRADVVLHAYRLAKANGGSAGVDGVTFKHIESEGVDEWLSGIREELRAKAYRPQPVLRVMIPKPGGGWRPLGIPTIRDRVIQAAAKLVLEPTSRQIWNPMHSVTVQSVVLWMRSVRSTNYFAKGIQTLSMQICRSILTRFHTAN